MRPPPMIPSQRLPDIGQALRDAVTLQQQGRLREAEKIYTRVLEAVPDQFDALNLLGTVKAQRGQAGEAYRLITAALRVNPRAPDAWVNLGIVLHALKRDQEALESFDKALALKPGDADALYQRGNALMALGRAQDAVGAFGEFRRGFEKYEWRWRRSGMPSGRGYGRPLWLGEYPIERRTILLHAEQGLGDTIQFVRYVPMLARAGAKVVLEVQPQLKALLGQIEGAAAVVARGELLPAFDVHCPLGSLPLALRTEPATIPNTDRYIGADDAYMAKWRPRLEALGRPRIALAWSGNPQHMNDRNRSIPLSLFAPLWSPGAMHFVCVQRELRDGDAELLAREPRVTQLGRELDDFADTAAVLALVDLVITVDTSVAHLAGAMGRPVYILVPFSPDWRWTLAGESSRWYPTARLFRQPSVGDWDSVIERLRGELAGFSTTELRR